MFPTLRCVFLTVESVVSFTRTDGRSTECFSGVRVQARTDGVERTTASSPIVGDVVDHEGQSVRRISSLPGEVVDVCPRVR